MIVTPRKLAANRANAKKSTGPRTPCGKERSSMNALTHGMFSQRIVLPDESPAHFARFRDALLDFFLPHGIDELVFCEQIVSLSWRLRRLQRFSNSAACDLQRLSCLEQRLELSIRRCHRDFVKLRRRSQTAAQPPSPQAQAGPNDAHQPAPAPVENRYAIERFEPNAIDRTSIRAV